MAEWEPIDLIMLRYLEARGPSLQQGNNGGEKNAGHIANVINNFIASSPTLAFAGPGEGVVVGDSYKADQAGAIGPNSIAHAMSFTQARRQEKSTIDLTMLTVELGKLRVAMRKLAADLEEDLAVAEVGQAEKSASSNDGPSAIEHLRAAGRWALDVAESTGAEMAANAIRAALGLPE